MVSLRSTGSCRHQAKLYLQFIGDKIEMVLSWMLNVKRTIVKNKLHIVFCIGTNMAALEVTECSYGMTIV